MGLIRCTNILFYFCSQAPLLEKSVSLQRFSTIENRQAAVDGLFTWHQKEGCTTLMSSHNQKKIKP
ncbi:hypothetical protein DEM91_00335 [Prevotella sp. TCVGH]|nr:hypothetical protein [Prevotella sp. TCVGH]